MKTNNTCNQMKVKKKIRYCKNLGEIETMEIKYIEV